MSKQVRVRFAPSPTGMLHLGGLRTALYDYVFAAHNNGKFILRIEDTDRSRFVEGAFENLVDTLADMGLSYDEGPLKGGPYAPYVQSERLDIYRKVADQLVEQGDAYPCFCSKERLEEVRAGQQERKEHIKYDGHCRNLTKEEAQRRIDNGEEHVIRLKMPEEGSYKFSDLIRGEVSIEAAQIDDQVIIKSDGFPTYHLAAMVDDHLMEISHVLRGEEWLPSTPKHIQIYRAMGWEEPIWVHLPLILSTEKGKLSKRHGDFSVGAFVKKGFLKEALINFVALLGWHPSEDREIFSLEEMVQDFSFEKVNKAGAVFDMTKLEWMNGMYMRSIPLESLTERAREWFVDAGIDPGTDEKLASVLDTARDYATLMPELVEHGRIYYEKPEFDDEKLEVLRSEDSKKVCRYMIEQLSQKDDWTKDEVAEMVKGGMKALELKGKAYYPPIRLSLIGKQHGPDIPRIVHSLGLDETIRRFEYALNV